MANVQEHIFIGFIRYISGKLQGIVYIDDIIIMIILQRILDYFF